MKSIGAFAHRLDRVDRAVRGDATITVDRARCAPDLPQDVEPVHVGQFDVEQDDAWGRFVDGRQGRGAGFENLDAARRAVALQIALVGFRYRRHVFDNVDGRSRELIGSLSRFARSCRYACGRRGRQLRLQVQVQSAFNLRHGRSRLDQEAVGATAQVCVVERVLGFGRELRRLREPELTRQPSEPVRVAPQRHAVASAERGIDVPKGIARIDQKRLAISLKAEFQFPA